MLAEASPADPVAFRGTIPPQFPRPLLHMPSGFVYVSAAKTPVEIELRLNPRQRGIAVFGVARYRASIPYLAIAPRETFGDPETWAFFAGREAGHPVWVTRQQWESGRNVSGQWVPPAGAEIYEAQPPGERRVGEHSVTWNAPLHTWLLLYNCAPWTVEARFAPEPWGPWSPPVVMLSAAQDPSVICTLIMSDRRSATEAGNDILASFDLESVRRGGDAIDSPAAGIKSKQFCRFVARALSGTGPRRGIMKLISGTFPSRHTAPMSGVSDFPY